MREVVAEAGINRSTFYYHFEGVTGALEWMVSDFLKEYLPALLDIPGGETDVLVEEDFLLEQEKRVCSLIQRKKTYLNLFFNRYNREYFRQRFWTAFQKYADAFNLVMIRSREDICAVKRGIAYDYCLRVNFAIWFELLSYWHDREFHETAEDFVEIFRIMYSGIIGFENQKS